MASVETVRARAQVVTTGMLVVMTLAAILTGDVVTRINCGEHKHNYARQSQLEDL